MKLLAFSDLHRDLEQAANLVEMSASADLVIGAGDFASVHEGLVETIDALAAIKTPTVLVPGNNETADALREAAGSWPAATVLHGSGMTVDGAEIYDPFHVRDLFRAFSTIDSEAVGAVDGIGRAHV